jgi:hypothetical protein
LLLFQKEEWNQKIDTFLQIVLPQLTKVFLLFLLIGLVFLWIPTFLNFPAKSFFSQTINFFSSFSFAVMVSAIQGWLLIKGFEVIGKYQLPRINCETDGKKQVNFIQPTIFFLGFVLILSVIFDFLLSFFILPLTTGYLFVKLVKLSCTLKI